MGHGFVLALALAATVSSAQTDQPSVLPTTPKVTLLAGVGNAMGGFGLQAEGYFAGGRASVFGGLGYMPEVDRSWSGAAGAAGVRVFTSGEKHRYFAEGSVSLLAVECPTDDTQPKGDQKAYGPGLQVGYQLMKPSGFTLMLSVGAGYAMGGDEWKLMAGFGMGYTWSR